MAKNKNRKQSSQQTARPRRSAAPSRPSRRLRVAGPAAAQAQGSPADVARKRQQKRFGHN